MKLESKVSSRGNSKCVIITKGMCYKDGTPIEVGDKVIIDIIKKKDS